MGIGAFQIDEKVGDYLRREFKDLEKFQINFSILDKEQGYYDIHTHIRRRVDPFERTIVIRADPKTGEVQQLREGPAFWRP